MTIRRALSRIRDIACMKSRAALLLRVAALVLVAVLAAGCTLQVSPPSAGASGGQSASQSGISTTSSSSCLTCTQLMSQFPVLAAIGLSELEDLLDKYGPDVTVLLWIAAVILDL